MVKTLWKVQSSCYHLFRKNPVSAWILKKENEAISELLKFLPEKSIKSGLDVGSGRGNSLELIPNGEGRWVALDYSSPMIRRCRPHYQEVYFILGDAREMPFKGDCFDLALCIGVSEYLENLDNFLEEIWKLLKPGGFAVLTLAPPRLLNFCRWMVGHRIYPIRDTELRNSLKNIPFAMIENSTTLLQNQYLLRKEIHNVE